MVATNRRQIAEIVAGIVFAIFVVGNSWAQGSVHNEKILAAIEPFENIAETALKGDAKAAAKAFTIASVVHIWQEGDISIYGQESNYTTWRLAKKNLAIGGIDGQITQGDTFHNDRFPDLGDEIMLNESSANQSYQ